MKKQLVALAVGAVLAFVSPAGADTFSYDFSSPTGPLGTSQAYTSNGVTVTARGYSGISTPNNVGTPTNLFGKQQGGIEMGLGIAAGTNNEIQDPYFIQLDLTDVFSKLNVTSAMLSMASVTSGESYDIYGSNTQGVPGTKLIAGGTLDQTFFNLPNLGSFLYYSAGASNPDVLVAALTIQAASPVPEPGSLALTAAGLGSLAFWYRRRSVKA